MTDKPDTERDRDGWAAEPTTDLGDEQLAELSRLRAKLGFIPADGVAPRVIGGRYEILRTLGHGGMGVVYQVYDRDMDSCEVALKLVRTSHFEKAADAQTRLHQEARQMARLRHHPHVVTVLDVGSDAGATYLTMEYVAGMDLRHWYERHKPTPTQILGVYLGAARGLQAAHDIGIVHRDFKPDNVLVDTEGRAKVADFGIAAVREALVDDGERANGEGGPSVPRGTLPYMSPEQMAGERADARSDQFSFCVALWETLTGTLPHVWRDLGSQEVALLGEPACSDRVPSWLREPLRRGMAKIRSDRFGEMRDLIAVLEQGIARPARIRRISLGLSSSLVLGVSVALLVSVLTRPPATCEPFVDQLEDHWGPGQKAELEARREQAPESVDWAVVKLDELSSRWTRTARQACDGDQAPVSEDKRRACLEDWLGSLDQAVELLAQRGDNETLRHAPDLLARLEPPNGDYCALAGRPTDPELARLVEGARGAAEIGDQDSAEQLSLAALHRADKIAGAMPYTPGRAHAHAVRGEVLAFRRAFDEASEEYRQAERHAAGTNDLAELARIRISWARSLAIEPGHAEQAFGHFERAEPLFVAGGIPEDARLVGELIASRALVEERLGELDNAARDYAEAEEFFARTGSPILAARARMDLGVLNHGRGALQAAELDYRQAIATYRSENVPPAYPRLLEAQFNLGQVLLDRYYESADPRLADEGLDTLSSVIEHAPARLRMSALGYACQLAADAHRTQRLRELVDETLGELASTDLDAETRYLVQVQVSLALLTELEDPRGEAMIRELLDRADELDASLHWALARSWIEELEHEGRCEEAQIVLQQLHELDDIDELETWKRERPRGACK